MNRDFERTEAALASSVAGRAVTFLDAAIGAAWKSSSAAAAGRSIRRILQTAPAVTLVRTIAAGVMIAAALQPLLTMAMPATVVPAMPWWAFIVVALVAAIAAMQPEAIVRAWPSSAPARLFRR
jgi:hypothetical protein